MNLQRDFHIIKVELSKKSILFDMARCLLQEWSYMVKISVCIINRCSNPKTTKTVFGMFTENTSNTSNLHILDQNVLLLRKITRSFMLVVRMCIFISHDAQRPTDLVYFPDQK